MGEHPGGSALRHKDAPWVELVADDVLVEASCVEVVARAAADRVGQIADDHVKLPRVVLKLGLGIVNDKLQPGVGKSLLVYLQVVPAEVANNLVDIYHHTLLHALVAEDLAGSGAFPSSADEHRLGVGVVQHGGMDKELVVHSLIKFRTLRLPVQQENLSKSRGLHQCHLLELALASVQDPGHLHGPFQVRLQLLLQPYGTAHDC
mmetsp:Transcript_23336/g.64748  ORF Transcript_23336/g.64748 Transcript_23336/m.64748 type:complete len:205 (-) Transcript_23336:147-761(-)